MDWLLGPAALLAGALLALQAGANAQLSRAVDSPFGATTIQLSLAAVVMLGLAAATGGLLALRTLPAVPWWHAAGGLASALYVLATILLFPRLGAVTSVGLFIAGQMLASLSLDAVGLLGVPVRGLGATALVGTLAVLAGATLIVMGQDGARVMQGCDRAGWMMLGLLAGALLPVQGAVNALLRQDLGAPATVGAISFAVATLAMLAALGLAVGLLRAPPPRLRGVSGMPWWGWLGGLVGAAYVSAMFLAIPVIGAAATVGLTVAGQQVAAVLVDRHGWFRLPRRPVSARRLAGVVLLLAGVAVLKLA